MLAPHIGLFNTPWLILCAYVTSFTALVVQAVAASLASTPASAEEAARIGGAGRMRALVDISSRMAAPAAISGAVLVAVTAWTGLACVLHWRRLYLRPYGTCQGVWDI